MLGRICLTSVCLSLSLLALPMAARSGEIKPHAEGFWKVHPPRDVKAEFDKEDPMGLAYHRHIPTDCSIAWKDEEKNKVYCFSSPMSLSFFQDDPTDMLTKAGTFWASDHPAPRS